MREEERQGQGAGTEITEKERQGKSAWVEPDAAWRGQGAGTEITEKERQSKKAGSRERVRKILETGAATSAKLLVAAVKDEALKRGERYDAALEILNRLYGKSSALLPEAGDGRLEILFSKEAEKYAK